MLGKETGKGAKQRKTPPKGIGLVGQPRQPQPLARSCVESLTFRLLASLSFGYDLFAGCMMRYPLFQPLLDLGYAENIPYSSRYIGRSRGMVLTACSPMPHIPHTGVLLRYEPQVRNKDDRNYVYCRENLFVPLYYGCHIRTWLFIPCQRARTSQHFKIQSRNRRIRVYRMEEHAKPASQLVVESTACQL